MSEHASLDQAFADELAEVQALLINAADELGSPLGEVVHSRIRRGAPLLRAAVILTVAAPTPTTPAHDAAEQRRKRILLAGALEMLRVAMHVHRLLLMPGDDSRNGHGDGQDRVFMGGAILAGDYCFSRAAQMAARTDNPRVVRIFSQTLQIVSEQQLRHHFEGGGEFAEDDTLLCAGAEAAAALVDLDEAATAQAIAYGSYIASLWQAPSPTAGGRPRPALAVSPRGEAVQGWLQRTLNGKRA